MPICAAMPARTRPGSPCPDAPLAKGWLLNRLGSGFTLLTIDAEAPESLAAHGMIVPASRPDGAGRMTPFAPATSVAPRRRRLSDPPRQHVAARWERHDDAALRTALGPRPGKE